MFIPPSSNVVWTDLITGKMRCEFEFLALKILLGRISLVLASDQKPETIQKCADDVRNLLSQNVKLASVQRDLYKILGG